MSILSRPKIAPQQRFDLEDWNALIGALCGDSKLFTQKFWSANPLILDGFVTSGIGNTSATVTVAGSSLVAAGGLNKQSWFVAPSAEPAKTVALQAGTKNYLEVSLAYTGANELLRAFWDATANGGVGAEFNQLSETIENLELTIETSTSGFSGDANKVPIAIVETNGGGVIKTILDQRKLFSRLGQPQDESRDFAWGTKVESTLDITLSSITGSFVVGETVTFGGVETAVVSEWSNPILKVKDLSAATFSIADGVVGGSGNGTLDQAEEMFTGSDKDIKGLKDMFDSLMTEIKLMKGTSRWFENATASMTGVTNFINTVISQFVDGAEYSWDGSALSITDTSGTPADADQLAGVRVLGDSRDLLLTRQDGTGGSTTLAMADGEVLFVKLPATGNRDFSGLGVGDTNFQVVTKSSFVASDENFWIAYREGTKVYIRNYGEMETGESAPISDPAKAELEAQINANQASNNQDRSSKLIEGGTWSLANNGNDLTLSADAYIEVGGLNKVRNTILNQIITLPNVDSVAYVTINRSGVAADNLAVTVADVNALTLTDSMVIIARKVSTGVLVGMSCFLLKPDSYLELDGAEAEINRLLGQLKLKPHETAADKARIDASDVTLLNGTILSQVVGSFILDFSGAVINFTTGTILKEDDSTPLGTNFTPQTIPVSEYFWYGISLTPGTVSADNTQLATVQVDLASGSHSTEASAPKPVITGSIKLGAIEVFNNASAIEINIVRKLGVGSGSGAGGAGVKADYLESVVTTLPTGAAVTLDGQAGVNGDLVLFTKLASNNNRVYELGGVGSSLTWTAQRVFDGQLDPTDADTVRLRKGDAFAEQLAVFNDTNFLVNDIRRSFDGVSPNFIEEEYIDTITLLGSQTGTVISALTFAHADFEGFEMVYKIKEATSNDVRFGTLRIATNGTDISFTDAFNETNPTGIVLDVAINGTDVEISYDSGANGATMRADVKRVR